MNLSKFRPNNMKIKFKLLVRLFLILVISTIFLGLQSCKKLEDFEGNNQSFELTNFEFEETLTFVIPNGLLNFQGIGNCLSLPFFTIDYEAFIPTENPNPYASLVYNINPKEIELELVNISDCDFGMLEKVSVYIVDNGVTGSVGDFILQDPNDPTATHNAVKVGEYLNIPEGIGSTMSLSINQDAILDQFIQAGTFQTFMSMTFDKAFTASEAIIKSKMTLYVTFINE